MPQRRNGTRISVTGATGAVGRELARTLAAQGSEARLLVRDADKARALGLPGDVVHADYQDVRSLERALAGTDAVFVVTANPLRPADDAGILEAARAAGVRHVVKLSGLSAADPAAQDLVSRWNRDCEDRLRASGLPWTILRIRTLASNTLSWAPAIRDEGVVRAFAGQARSACVDPRDVAEVAALVLTESGHAGRVHALTGPEPISAEEQTEELSRVLRLPLRFEELTPEQALDRWERRLPPPVARAMLEGARQQADGSKARVEHGVEEVTGRPPGSYGSWARAHAALFTGE